MDIYNPGNKLSTLIEIAVFRIIQEGLNNIKKHSRATKSLFKSSNKKQHVILANLPIMVLVLICQIFRMQKNRIFIVVDLEYTVCGSGQNFLKGKLKIHSQPGRGTALLLQIPIEQNRRGGILWRR